MIEGPLHECDFPGVAALHERQGFDYKMPDLGAPQFIVKHGVWENGGKLLAAGGLRLEAETYLWIDPDLPATLKYKVIACLGRRLAAAAWRVGLDCIVAYLPPSIPATFCTLLEQLGWSADRGGWQPWSKHKCGSPHEPSTTSKLGS